MKYIIASDIHGSAYYTDLLVKAFFTEKADRMILLGDYLYHGPRNPLPRDYDPKKVAELLNGIADSIIGVRGNCDAEIDQVMLKFPIMADYAMVDLGTTTVFLTHGHIYNRENLLPMKNGDVLLSGHTHIPLAAEEEGLVFLNPGSIALPKETDRHSYMTLENRVFYWKDLETGELLAECALNG